MGSSNISKKFLTRHFKVITSQQQKQENMNTQNINLNQSDNEESKTSKFSKVKKIVGKATGLAGAAGLGAAATVSAEAMTAGEEEAEGILVEAIPTPDETLENEVVEPEIFDPNDIKLDEVAEVELHQETVSTHSAQNVSVDDVVAEVLSPEPITMENTIPSDNIAMINIDSTDVEPEVHSESAPEDNWDVDGYNSAEDIDDVLMADIPNSDEPNVLDDILNA